MMAASFPGCRAMTMPDFRAEHSSVLSQHDGDQSIIVYLISRWVLRMVSSAHACAFLRSARAEV
jgi:hypothetical protein